MTLSKQFQNSAYESVLWVSSESIFLSPPCLAIECSPLVPIVHSTLFWIIIKFDLMILTTILLLTSFSHLWERSDVDMIDLEKFEWKVFVDFCHLLI